MARTSRTFASVALSTVCIVALALPAGADPDTAPTNVFGSVEPIANPTVQDTTALRSRSLAVREAFAERVLECGVVDRVIDLLTGTGAISTIDAQNTTFAVTAGGFNGRTTTALGYTVDDDGPGAATHADIAVLTNALGYVFSQGSAFLLDADGPTSFAFPANYVILRFPTTPSLAQSAALFETVGDIDPALFSTTTSGYTQYGPDYVSLQSAVPAAQFIAGYVAAADEFGVRYSPIVGGEPALFRGGADFPFNNWATNPTGGQYLNRIPQVAWEGLATIRSTVQDITAHALNVAKRGPKAHDRSDRGTIKALGNLPCRVRQR